MSEAELQKLKVTELKELLHKHDLPQTGKKDDLVKRLLENNIAPEAGEEELVEPDANGTTTEAPEASSSTAPTTTEPQATSSEAPAAETTLTPEQQAMKARAERFGIPFNPNAATSARTKPTPTPATKSTESAAAATPAPAKKEKAGAIDKAPLGISEDVLAKRAAKFGLPEKKEVQAPATKTAAAPSTKPASTTSAPKPEVELTPEQKEKMAADEEKKRKRAEKFGTAKPANGVESEGSDAKKAKV